MIYQYDDFNDYNGEQYWFRDYNSGIILPVGSII